MVAHAFAHLVDQSELWRFKEVWLADAKMWIVKAPGGVVAHSHRDVVAQVDVVAQGDVVA